MFHVEQYELLTSTLILNRCFTWNIKEMISKASKYYELFHVEQMDNEDIF